MVKIETIKKDTPTGLADKFAPAKSSTMSTILSEKPTPKLGIKSILVIGVAIFIAAIMVFSLVVVNVPAGQVGILFSSTGGGVQHQPFGEGWHLIVPFVNSVTLFDTRTTASQFHAAAASADLQTVNSEVTVSYHAVGSSAPGVYQNIGPDFADKIISPAVQEKFKATTSKFTAEELITEREQVRIQIADSLQSILGKYNISLDQVSITNFDFSPQFNTAIEAKVTAQQNVLTEQQNLEIEQIRAQQAVASAQGQANSTILNANASAQVILLQAQAQAEALRLQREQVTPELIALRTIEKWNGQLPTFSANGGQSPFVMLDGNRFTTPILANDSG